jgi:hypothetical protein
VVRSVVALQALCSVFLCVVAATNVSSAPWHPLPLVLVVVLIGSTAHGVITTCKRFVAFASLFLFSRPALCYLIVVDLLHFSSFHCQGRFCIQGT